MKTLFLTAASFLVLSSTVHAADLTVASFPEQAATLDWSGIYAGAAVGWLGGKTKSAYSTEIAPLGDDYLPLSDSWTRQNSPDGIMLGGYAGYNWHLQDSGVVLGVEGDFFWADAKDSVREVVEEAGYGRSVHYHGWENISWTWAVRGRLGWAFEDVMPYIAGGVAGARLTSGITGDLYESDTFQSTDTSSQTQNYVGWTFGGGVDWMFGPNWMLRLDYQYKDLGQKQNLAKSGTVPSQFDFSTVNTTKLTSNQITIGAAVRF